MVNRYASFWLVALLASACSHSSKGTAMSHGDAEGLWQQSREVEAPGTEGKSMSDASTFRYEDDHITLRLMVISKLNWKSPDGFYTLKSRWQGDTLEYLAPLGQWTPLAAFHDGKFVASGDGKTREYVRISPDQVSTEDADILKPGRAVHDYSKTMK